MSNEEIRVTLEETEVEESPMKVKVKKTKGKIGGFFKKHKDTAIKVAGGFAAGVVTAAGAALALTNKKSDDYGDAEILSCEDVTYESYSEGSEPPFVVEEAEVTEE